MMFLKSARIISGGLLFGLMWFSFPGPVFAEDPKSKDLIGNLIIPDVVARVNGKPIYSKQIKFRLVRMLKQINPPVDLTQKGRIIRALIDKEVVRELVYHEGKSRNLTVDSETVEKEMEALRSAYESEEEFQEALQKREITVDDLKRSMGVDILTLQLLEKQVKGNVEVTDWAVRKYYDDNKEKFFRPETFRARHIFIAPYPLDLLKTTPKDEVEAKKKEHIAQAEKKIRDILQEVKDGADFAELAKKYSQDAGSAEKGGDIDFIYRGVFDPAFDEAVGKLKPGEMSDVVQTRFGYHVIKLIENRPALQAPFTEMKQGIQKYLYMEEAKKKVEEYVETLRDEAKVEVLF